MHARTSPAAARRRAGAAAALAVLGAAALPTAADAQDRATRQATALAIGGLGGERALRNLSSFRLQSTGSTFIPDEALEPGDDLNPASTFRVRLDYDLRGGGDRLRADSVRTSLGTDREVSEVVVGTRGFITGADQNFAPPGSKPMTSDRWAPSRASSGCSTRSLYVHQLLRGRAWPARSCRAPAERPAAPPGRGARRRRPRAAVARRGTGHISRLTTVDHNYFRGDVQTVVDFRGWRRGGAACGSRARCWPRTAWSSIARRAPRCGST